jgi:hypothetical protein
MSLVTPISEDRDTLGARLAGVYTRWACAYLLLVVALWTLGFEAIFYHPTPFYGLFSPAFASPLGPLVAVWAMVIGYLLLRVTFPTEGDAARRRSWWRWLPLGFLATVTALAVFADADGASVMATISTGAAEGRWHVFAVAVFVAFFGLLWAVLQQSQWLDHELSEGAARWTVVGIVIFAFLFAAAIAMIRGGLDGISQAYMRYEYEYIGDIGMGLSIKGYIADYAKNHDFLSIHSKVHPPGPGVMLWILSYVVGREALALSLATMAVGALAVVPLYAWVSDMTNRRVALIAALIYALMPSIVLFTATSGDILFTPVTITTLFLFWRAIHRNSVRYACAAGIGYAFMSLLSFSLLVVGIFFGLVGLWRLADASRRGTVIKTALVMGAAMAATHGALWLWTGFNVIEIFTMSKAQFDLDQVNLDLVTPRYAPWIYKFINPLCWFFYAGIPASLLFCWRLRRPSVETKPLFIIFALTLLTLNLLYLARGEGERSAMYIMPFIAAPAAHLIDEWVRQDRSLGPLAATLAFLAFQCWFIESYFYTYW